MSELRNQVTPDRRRLAYLASGVWDGTTLPGRVAAHATGATRRARSDEHGTHLTYGDLWARAAAVAGFLGEQGIGAGDVVSVQLPNRLETTVVALGVLASGAVINPLLPNYPGPRACARLPDRTAPRRSSLPVRTASSTTSDSSPTPRRARA